MSPHMTGTLHRHVVRNEGNGLQNRKVLIVSLHLLFTAAATSTVFDLICSSISFRLKMKITYADGCTVGERKVPLQSSYNASKKKYTMQRMLRTVLAPQEGYRGFNSL